jgi:hypothetical protein
LKCEERIFDWAADRTYTPTYLDLLIVALSMFLVHHKREKQGDDQGDDFTSTAKMLVLFVGATMSGYISASHRCRDYLLLYTHACVACQVVFAVSGLAAENDLPSHQNIAKSIAVWQEVADRWIGHIHQHT